MSNGFYMGQQGFATNHTQYGQNPHQQYGNIFSQTPNTSSSAPPVVTQYKTPPTYGTQFGTAPQQPQQQNSYGYGQGSQYNMDYSGGNQGYGTNQGYGQIETGTSYGAIGQPVQRGNHRGRGRGRGRGGHGHNYNAGPKPIKATEIKAYIYAWCNQFKKKPEYAYETIGSFPKVTYKCTIAVPGFASNTQEARSKKDAQTLAAWEFSETLIKMGKVGRGDLPQRPECVVKTSESAQPKQSKIGLLKPEEDENEEFGGWTSENARQRLNRFCMAERISCDFQNYSEGPCHSKVSISTLSFIIERADVKPLTVTVRASNKKTANSTCALQMVRLLYKEGLIEKFGEKPSSAPKALKKEIKEEATQEQTGQGAEGAAGTKRKASNEGGEGMTFDANGNWTLETAKTKLSKFYAANNMDFNEPLQCAEVGHPPSKQYQCKFSLTHEGQTFGACVLADNKKSAQRRACLDMVIQLYKAGFIQGNRGDRYPPGLMPKRGRGIGRRGGLGRGGGTAGVPWPVPGANPETGPSSIPEQKQQQPWETANNGGFKTFASM